MEREQGIEMKKISKANNNGKQVIKLEGEIVSKEKIQKKVHAMETSMNRKFNIGR